MKTKWFLTSWLTSAVIMYALSFLWHGVLLNDYVNIKYPMWLYFLLAGVVYLVIGLILTYLYYYTYTKKMQYKGALMGACLGFFIYLIAFVLGVSFNQNSLHHIVVDFIWQMVEQGIGGSSVGFLFGFLSHMHKVENPDGQS
ncbi:MAG: hypothetical protein HKN79_08295 [Flavobacteriales bacterium]|nr:hypothetical protein [Flavobacteriales bacterium]